MTKSSILAALCAALLALSAGCAAPGVPQPPSLHLPVAVDNLSAVRKGSRVVLVWSPPQETTDRAALRGPSITRICRVINQYPTNACQVVKELRDSDLATLQPSGRRPLVTFEDVLPASLIRAQDEATYAIEVANARGRSAGLSNQVRVSLVPVPAAPAEFQAAVDAQGPVLRWSAPPVPPVAGLGYRSRLYRRVHGGKDFVMVVEQPYRVGENEARDGSFEWEKTYDYKAAAVSVQESAKLATEIEGDDSAALTLQVHDTFPPAVPTGLQAVFSSVGQKPFIDLTWAPGLEPDLAGYLVYRRVDGGPFGKAPAGTVKAPSWRDTDVQPGHAYQYAVSAIDLRGNESAPSAAAGETVPLEVK
ncbi:MAG: hypothetical protein P4M01_04125 [Acidobacteriota bacterium]|nr:hypothetical protein [Acidobacteriota bacterium]